MTVYTYLSDDPSIKVNFFSDAEEAWFWFIQSYTARLEGARITAGAGQYNRPCEPVDILKIVDRLYRNCRLTRDHIYVMRHYGLRQMAPDKHHPKEQRSYYLWSQAMQILAASLSKKGLMEDTVIPFPSTYHNMHSEEARP